MPKPSADFQITDEDALAFHSSGKPGKLEIRATKPLTTARELSLAYSPGVAVPCLEIERDPALAYDYTSKGNMVAVISNGTAVLGLGNLGALASKPVMEGKAVLFKRFADIDGIDLEVDTQDVDEFIDCVRHLGHSFGGINLEDIKAPECFIIEQRLREIMDIPVFHDDQHGTAIIVTAGLINALHLTGRTASDCRVVINGAGSAGIACAELIKIMGVTPDKVILCDTLGVIHRGREAGMNQWKSGHAIDTDLRSLGEAVAGCDIFIGLSAKGAMTPEMVAAMADRPIIFALANPDPEITPEAIAAVRDDAIVATGRSDYPNQVNNVLGFPYIFRGALDVRASTINDALKLAAAQAIPAAPPTLSSNLPRAGHPGGSVRLPRPRRNSSDSAGVSRAAGSGTEGPLCTEQKGHRARGNWGRAASHCRHATRWRGKGRGWRGRGRWCATRGRWSPPPPRFPMPRTGAGRRCRSCGRRSSSDRRKGVLPDIGCGHAHTPPGAAAH